MASELFGDFVEDLYETYQKEKRIAKEIVEDLRFDLKIDLTKEKLIEVLQSHEKVCEN